MKFVYTLLVFLAPLFAYAQQSDSQLAYTYYQNKEYDKAAQLFLQLYERNRSASFLDYYIICLINDKQYDKAEEVLKKYLKTDDKNKDFLINLGFIYEQQGKSKKSEEYFEKAIQKLAPTTSDINSLANKFRNIREYGWAIRTYRRGQELLKQPDAFMSELGENYMMERNFEKMFDLFIQVLQTKPGEINNITSKLNFARSYDMGNSIDHLIGQKLEELFKQNDYPPVFDELAVWYALQQKNYEQALRHANLLNQKVTEKTYIFANIAQEAKSRQEYAVAIAAYKKILGKGKENNPHYLPARKDLLTCEYERSLQERAETEQFRQIADSCENYMREYGYTSGETDIAILLADIYAYRLNLPDSADRILSKSITMRRLNQNTISLLKSKRADLLTYMDNIWEATILYTQIEKSNPNNDIGYEAKLKKAWLAYYAGDLLWARAQFDVLKGSTTKLISNDAIQISHFININYDEGGENTELEKMAKTDYLIYKRQFDKALPILDSLVSCDKPGIADYASLQKAKVFLRQNQPEKAEELLDKLKSESQQTYIQAEAIFKLAQLKGEQKAFSQAKELYKTLVSEYPGSVYSIEAGRLYREMKEQ